MLLSMDVYHLLSSSTVVLLSLLLSVLLLVIWYLRRNDDYWLVRGIPFIPRASWFSVIKTLYSKHIHEICLENYKKFGRFYGDFEGSQPVLVCADPALLKNMLVKDFHSFSSRRKFDLDDSIFGKMITLLNGEDWKRVRSAVTPAFTSRRMRKMTNIINSCTQTLIGVLDEYHQKNVSMDIKKAFGTFTMDVIASSAFATKINSHHDPNNPFVTNARKAFRQPIFQLICFLLLPLKLMRLLRLDPFDNKEMKFFKSVTLQIIEERRRKGERGEDFLQLMMDAAEEKVEAGNHVDGFRTMDLRDEEADHFGSLNSGATLSTIINKRLSTDEVIAQCVLFFSVGFETVSSTLGFTAYSLALHPEIQEKLIKEIDDVFERNEEITYDVIREMKYLDCVMSETLRMYPQLIMSERTATEDYFLVHGELRLPLQEGMIVKFPNYAMHYDPEFFPEPEKFKPERFLEENQKDILPFTYLPFGAGPRNCLGMRFALMEMKLCLGNVLRQFRFHLAPETKVPPEYEFVQGLLSSPDIMVKLEKRSDVN